MPDGSAGELATSVPRVHVLEPFSCTSTRTRFAPDGIETDVRERSSKVFQKSTSTSWTTISRVDAVEVPWFAEIVTLVFVVRSRSRMLVTVALFESDIAMLASTRVRVWLADV